MRAGSDSVNLDRVGLACGLSAHGIWGLVPLYYKTVAMVPEVEVLAHRVVWSAVLLGVILIARRRFGRVLDALRDRRTLGVLAATTVLVATNWFLFIFAVSRGRVLEASLGYFINPLVNVFLGVLVLHERLTRLAAVSVALAAVAVVWMTIQTGVVPWISLTLAVSFGLYGLLRKTARVDAVPGLFVETLLLSPVALGFLAWWHHRDMLWFTAQGPGVALLLTVTGVVTAVPLMCFAEGMRRLPLTTMGFLQYVAPTGHFLLAVLVFAEPMDLHRLLAFALIWLALGIYTTDLVRRRRARVTATE